MHAFHGDFPLVTALETATRIVNLRETNARTASHKLPAMPLLVPPFRLPPAQGGKRRLAIIGFAVALVFTAIASWSVLRPGGYGQSRSGCVAITIPSSTGGALLHECGTGARVMCRNAFGKHDRLSLLIRPQCRIAGLR